MFLPGVVQEIKLQFDQNDDAHMLSVSKTVP